MNPLFLIGGISSGILSTILFVLAFSGAEKAVPVVKVGDLYALANPGVSSDGSKSNPFVGFIEVLTVDDGIAELRYKVIDADGKTTVWAEHERLEEVGKFHEKLN